MQTATSERTAAEIRADIDAEEAKQEELREQREPKAAKLEAAAQGSASVAVEELVELETTVASQDRLLEASERRLAALRQELEEAAEREDRAATRAEVVALAVRATEAEEHYSEALDEAVAALTKRVSKLGERFERWGELHRAGHAEAEELVGRGIPGLLRQLAAEGHGVRGLQTDPARTVRLTERDRVEGAIIKLMLAEVKKKAESQLVHRR